MTAPDWLHIGSGKSGSTSLAVYLAEHPQIYVSPMKEPGYFLAPGKPPRYSGPIDEARVNQTKVWEPDRYADLFAGRRPGQLAGELSQAYLTSPVAPAAVRNHNPDARIIAVLRHPADRAFSAWAACRRAGSEPLDTFEAAMAAEPQRIADGWAPLWWHVERGWYARGLRRWLEHFPREQIRVWLYEDLRADPVALTREVFEFLGVDPEFVPSTQKHHNVGLVPRSRRLQRFVGTPSAARHAIGRFVPPSWRAPIASRVLLANERRLEFDPRTRRELTARYRPDIEELGELIGRDLSAWLSDGR
jgi:hypothetical protein